MKKIKPGSVLLTTFCSGIAVAGGLNFPPTSLSEDAGARVHFITSGGPLYVLGQGGTSVSPDYAGSFLAYYHTPANGDLFNTTVSCTGDGLDASGNIDLLEADSWVVSNVGFVWQAGVNPPPFSDTFHPSCDITIGNTGHVVGGWANSMVFPGGGGQFVVSSYLYDAPRVIVTFIGSTCPMTGQPLATIAQSVRTTLFEQLDQGNSLGDGELDALVPGLPPLCTVFGVSPLAFGECDPLMNAEACAPMQAKAVPVPTFAAGSMALGLLAISYLTRRRRLSLD